MKVVKKKFLWHLMLIYMLQDITTEQSGIILQYQLIPLWSETESTSVLGLRCQALNAQSGRGKLLAYTISLPSKLQCLITIEKIIRLDISLIYTLAGKLSGIIREYCLILAFNSFHSEARLSQQLSTARSGALSAQTAPMKAVYLAHIRLKKVFHSSFIQN